MIARKEVLAALDNVLRSPAFHRTQRQGALLRHIVERTLDGDRDGLKEYSIAIEVFGRPATYDPQIDSTVRVEVSKLRARLASHYSGEGAGDPVRISIPKGSYAAVFEEHIVAPPALMSQPGPEPSPVALAPEPSAPSRRAWIGWAAGSAAAGAAAWFLWPRTFRLSAGLSVSAADPAERGGASPAAFRAMETISRDLASAGLSAPLPEARLVAFVRTGRPWRHQAGELQVVAEIRDTERAVPLWASSWAGAGPDTMARSVREIRAAMDRLRHAPAESPARLRALGPYRDALRITAEQKSFVLQTAAEKAQRSSLDNLLQAVALLERALAEDPSFADAKAKLAWVYHYASEYDPAITPKVRQAAMSALAAGPSSEANFVLAYQSLFTEWNPVMAEQHFAACLDQAAFHADAIRLHTDSACICGQPGRAASRLEPALGVDPRSPVLRAAAYLLADFTGDSAEMERLARESLAWEPHSPLARWQLGGALAAQGKRNEARSQYQIGLDRDPGSKKLVFALARMQAVEGRGADAVAMALRAGIGQSNPSLIGVLELERGRKSDAAAWFARAVSQRELSLCYLVLDSKIRALRQDQSLARVIESIRLPA